MKKLTSATFIIFLSSFASAGGLISLKGNLLGCDKVNCEVKVDSQIYKINLSKLSEKQKKDLLSKKREALVDSSFATSSITEVKDY